MSHVIQTFQDFAAGRISITEAVARLQEDKRTLGLRAEIASLKSELVRFKAAASEHLRFDMAAIVSGTPEERLVTERDAALAQVKELREAISQYGRHENDCWNDLCRMPLAICICGFGDALERLFAPKVEND